MNLKELKIELSESELNEVVGALRIDKMEALRKALGLPADSSWSREQMRWIIQVRGSCFSSRPGRPGFCLSRISYGEECYARFKSKSDKIKCLTYTK